MHARLVLQALAFITGTHVLLCVLRSGGWNSRAKIPVDRASVSWRWDGTAKNVDNELRSLVTSAWPDDSPFRRLNTVYDSCMDVDTVEALGNTPLQPFLQRIAALESVEDLRLLFLDLMLQGPLPFHVEVSQGFRDNTINSLFLSPAGLSMPDAGWYSVSVPESLAGTLSSERYTDEDREEGQQKLLEFFRKLNELAGSSPEEADNIANQTLALETQLAEWRLNKPVITDPLGPELSSLSELVELCPSIPWRKAFEAIAEGCSSFNYTCNERLLADDKLVVVTNVNFFSSLDAALSNETMLNTSWKPLLVHVLLVHVLFSCRHAQSLRAQCACCLQGWRVCW
jgi:predicted metalloendopeptidase